MNIKNWLIGKLAIVGKFTRTDIKYLVKGGFWLSTKSIISIIISLFTAIAFANLLSQDIYGIYKYIITIIALLALSSLGGMGASVTRSVARGYVGSLIPAIKTSIKWGLLGSLASIAISIYYFVNGNLLLGTAFVIASIFIPFRDSLSLYQSFLGGKKMFKKMSRYTIISNIVAAASLMAALFLTRNILFLVFAYLAPRIILNFIFLQKTIREENVLRGEEDKDVISYGKHLSFLRGLTMIAEQLDKILLWHYIGPASVAVYSFAQSPPKQILGFLNNIFPLYFPKVAQRRIGELKQALPRKIVIFTSLIAVIVAVYILFAPLLYKILFPQYIEAILFSQIFSLILVINIPRSLLSDVFKAHAKKKQIYTLSIFNSFTRIGALAILLPLYGIMGAIVAALASSALGLFLSIYFFRKAQ